MNYRSCGVDIAAGDRLVDRIKLHAKRTVRPGVLGGLGGFGALFEFPVGRYRQPVLVSGADGVGTKLKLALELNRFDTIGIDLVAMCANDVLTAGAAPLFFLDYYASGKLDVGVAEEVIKGIADGCVLAGAALMGGETAELPGLYAGGDYDLAGFCVGVVEKDSIIDGSKVRPGAVLLGLASSGLHSNGYSLVRKILESTKDRLDLPFSMGRTLNEIFLAPTRIYVKSILRLLDQVEVLALAHITGGGLTENVPRVLPVDTKAVVDVSSWRRPSVFHWLQQQGNVADDEMLRTFNCGVGMVVVVAADDAGRALTVLQMLGEIAWKMGFVVSSDGEPFVEFVR